MINYSILGHNLKRKIFNFCSGLSGEFSKSVQKFITEMVYGLLSGKSCYLSDIARKLNEAIALDKTVERLSRNLKDFDDTEKLTENYFQTVKEHFDDSTVLIIDDSDITKTCSKKLEGLCKVHDGSTGKVTNGYWYAGVSALTSHHKQPIPVYSHVYSSQEEEYVSNNAETLKSLAFLSAHFPKTNIRALDRGYDAGYIFNYFIPRDESFIVRTRGDRNCFYKNKKIVISKLAKKLKSAYSLKFETKDGRKSNCKLSIAPVTLPDYPNKILNLVVCSGLGKEPLMLLTNIENTDKKLCLTITKVYLMRWRIEEYYKFKKQGFGFEKFLVRSLKSIRNLDLILSIAIGFIGTLTEKIKESIEVLELIAAAKRLYGLSKFTFYAISDGLFEIFCKLYSGIAAFFPKKNLSKQLWLPGCR